MLAQQKLPITPLRPGDCNFLNHHTVINGTASPLTQKTYGHSSTADVFDIPWLKTNFKIVIKTTERINIKVWI